MTTIVAVWLMLVEETSFIVALESAELAWVLAAIVVAKGPL